jgi:hypothetical protein
MGYISEDICWLDDKPVKPKTVFSITMDYVAFVIPDSLSFDYFFCGKEAVPFFSNIGSAQPLLECLPLTHTFLLVAYRYYVHIVRQV